MAVFDFNKLARRRDELRITNKQIAALKNISETTLSRIFKGETKDPSFSVIADICDVLRISLDDIAGRGVPEEDLPDDTPSGMVDALTVMRDHISRIIYHIRIVENEKYLANLRQIDQLQEQLSFIRKTAETRTLFLYGSVVLNIVLIASLVVSLLVP